MQTETENADFLVEEMREEWLDYDDVNLNSTGKNILRKISFSCAHATKILWTLTFGYCTFSDVANDPV